MYVSGSPGVGTPNYVCARLQISTFTNANEIADTPERWLTQSVAVQFTALPHGVPQCEVTLITVFAQLDAIVHEDE